MGATQRLRAEWAREQAAARQAVLSRKEALEATMGELLAAGASPSLGGPPRQRPTARSTAFPSAGSAALSRSAAALMMQVGVMPAIHHDQNRSSD
jgi:hypothetical protein